MPCPVGGHGHLPRPSQSGELPTGLSGRCVLATWQGPGLCPVLRPALKSSQRAQSPRSATEKLPQLERRPCSPQPEKRLHCQKYPAQPKIRGQISNITFEKKKSGRVPGSGQAGQESSRFPGGQLSRAREAKQVRVIRTRHPKHATSAENSQMWGRPLPSPSQPNSRTHASPWKVVGILQHPLP